MHIYLCAFHVSALAEHFKQRGITPDAWYFNTDGAPSHFKNRFTMQSLFKFKSTSGATTILWETCAPGHGKGPWDGIGAVIKRFLRKLEKNSQLYAQGPRDVFCALLDNFKQPEGGSKVSINAFVFHYILASGEPGLPGRKNVWSAITRPSVRPTVTALPGIRSFFCFRVAGPDVLAYRELSCRCRCCIEHRWTDCKSEDAGAWKRVVMSNTPANASTRTQGARGKISVQRQS